MTRGLFVVSLALMYLATLGSLALGDLAVGLLVGGAAHALGHTPRGEVGTSFSQVLWLPYFLWGVALEILRGSAYMVLVVFGRRPWEQQGVVEVEVGSRSVLGVVVSSLVVGLSPGTILLDVDKERGLMRFHVIDAADPAAVRAQIQRFYETYQLRVFP
jgi:multisubunit Na+/H+ antiporter MnhE subunit